MKTLRDFKEAKSSLESDIARCVQEKIDEFSKDFNDFPITSVFIYTSVGRMLGKPGVFTKVVEVNANVDLDYKP